MTSLSVSRLTFVVTALIVGCGGDGSNSPRVRGEPAPPRIEMGRVAATQVTHEVDAAADRGAAPNATLITRIQSPERFIISGRVVPRHNSGILFSVRVRCFNTVGAAAVQRTLTAGKRDAKNSGFTVGLRFSVSHADICSINAMARPERFRSVRIPRQAVARVSLQCPMGCSVG